MALSNFFSAVNKFERAYNEARFGKGPRDLTDADYDAWSAAADEGFKPTIRTIQQAQTALRRINPVRWRQVQSDYKWVQKQMKRLGLNPEDARYIL